MLLKDKNTKIKDLESQIIFFTSRLMFAVDELFTKSLIDEFDDLIIKFDIMQTLIKDYQIDDETEQYSFCHKTPSYMQLRDDVVDLTQPSASELISANKFYTRMEDNYFVIPKLVNKE
ncbi:hypothetical protein [Mycoplasma sp. SG1]|uniref:hypothetical protein n=1 Tax=Mycoplasma sp. SG1 TaxID=2810348 RepID=UPI002023C1D8|nr:hypothetical protein [Mycoplasma sp. SG1]URM53018.1 hypothetical protein JRW51_01585 [Mycoplasma sp. SG1]